MKLLKIVSDFLESNTFVLTKGEECLIVDAGAPTEKVAMAVEGKKVVGILLTHGHYDHSFYVKDYIKRFKTNAYISKEGQKTLGDPKLNYGEDFKIKDFSGFKFLDGDGKLKLGEFDVEFYQTPGHSKCGESFLIEKNLFAGDTVFETGIGRTDFVGGDVPEMIASLKKLSGLDFDELHSGHYRSSTKQRQSRNIGSYIKFLSREKQK